MLPLPLLPLPLLLPPLPPLQFLRRLILPLLLLLQKTWCFSFVL
jgi:hypothetical protein